MSYFAVFLEPLGVGKNLRGIQKWKLVTKTAITEQTSLQEQSSIHIEILCRVLTTEQARSLLCPDLKTPQDFPFKITWQVQYRAWQQHYKSVFCPGYIYLALINRAGGLYGRTQRGLYTRPMSRFLHTDRLSSVNKMFIICQNKKILIR